MYAGTLAKKVALLTETIIILPSSFFFVALMRERVADFEKCKHIYRIMHCRGWRLVGVHTCT